MTVVLSKMQKIVLSYPKLKERIETRDNPKKEKETALKNLKEIAADFSRTYINSFEKMLDASLPRLYDGLNFNENGLDLKELTENNCVVFVPNHQSHADYIALNYLVYRKYRFPVYIAGGINLNIFPIGKLFRKSGCFFIRRSFANDINYKLTMEAYLYYLLKTNKPIEFFFEGGRSRSGKLLPPKYGLYHMILDVHNELVKEEGEKRLLFVPVSIVHEYVPEQKSLAKEMGGGKKKKESAGQLLGLFKLFAYQFGNVHISLGEPVEYKLDPMDDPKKQTQDLAFKCFRKVGKNMMVTPSSLLSLVLLDEPQGALIWNDILSKARSVIEYCDLFEVPYTESLKKENFEETLERAMDIMIGNKKINVIGRNDHGNVFYSIKEECRIELLYFKNTILHHFLVPWIINTAWINLFNGTIENVDDLRKFFLRQREQLKHEFYLPTVSQFLYKTLKAISYCINREVHGLVDCMNLSHKELYQIASKMGVFSKVCSYINEGYYCCALAVRSLMKLYPGGFKHEHYLKKVKEMFDAERSLGRIVKYQESYSIPITRTSMRYFEQRGMVKNDQGVIKIVEPDKFDKLINIYEKNLSDNLTFNIRATSLNG